MEIKGIPIKEFPYWSQKYTQQSENWNEQHFLSVNLGSKLTADPYLLLCSQLHIPLPKDLNVSMEAFKENVKSDKCSRVQSTSSV